MPWSHSLNAQKTAGVEQGGSVLTVLREADGDEVGAELLLCKPQQDLLPAGEVVGAQRRSPSSLSGDREPGLHVQDPRSVVRRQFLCNLQPIIGVQQCSWKTVIPLTIPSPTWALQG